MIAGILLAAGDSRRFGSAKLIEPLPDGTPIGVAAALRLATGVDTMFVVLRPEDRPLARLLAMAGLEAITCAGSSEGVGASLACGVRAASAADGWLIALADMPFIAPETIAAVARALRDGAPIAAPVNAGRRGHPVGFSREHFAALAALSGDLGARSVIAAADRLVLLPVADPGIHVDIDTREDLIDTRVDLRQAAP